MYIKIEDTSFPEVSSFIYTEFRRIYGVVFRTLLYGEAMIHLHIFLTVISLRSSFCEIAAFIVDCYFNHRDYNQQECDKCHLPGIGGGIGYLYAGLFSVNPLLGVALGAMTFVGLPLAAKNGS